LTAEYRFGIIIASKRFDDFPSYLEPKSRRISYSLSLPRGGIAYFVVIFLFFKITICKLRTGIIATGERQKTVTMTDENLSKELSAL